MEFLPTRIPEVIRIIPRVFGDERGFFLESWQQKKFAEAGIPGPFVQDNHSRSARHILRGLHYQLEQPQGKLVRAVTGSIFDVAVDMRRSSSTLGQWVGCILSEENREMLWIPPGFAHGFLVLSERADFLYKCTDYYAPATERVLLWNDPHIGIDWPLPAGIAPVLAPRDAAGIRFGDADLFP